MLAAEALDLLQLASTEEFIDGQMTGNLGEVLIRCAVAMVQFFISAEGGLSHPCIVTVEGQPCA